jgi:hypothetical protein
MPPDVTEEGKQSEIPAEEIEGSLPIEKTAPVTEEKTNLITEKDLKKIRDLMKDQRKIDKEKLDNLQNLVTKIVYESLLKQDLTTWLGALPNVNFYWLMGTHKKDITLADLCKKMATEYVTKACYSNELPSCLRAFNTVLTTCGLPNVTADGEIVTPDSPNTDTSNKVDSGETPLQEEKTLAEIFTDEENKSTGKGDADELNKGQPGVDLLTDETVIDGDSDPEVSNGEGDTGDTVADGKDNTLEYEYVDLDPWPFVDRSDEQGA